MRRFCSALVCAGVVVVSLLPCVEVLRVIYFSNPSVVLWVGFLGKFHPVILHIPIGVFVYIGCCEFLCFTTRGRCRIDITPALFLGSMMAVVATVFGYGLYLTGGYGVSQLMEEHKRDGIVFTLMALLTLFTKLHSLKEAASKVWFVSYRILLVSTLMMLVCASHHGGELSHGNPIDSWPPSLIKVQGAGELTADNDPLVFEQVVQPILAEKCGKCHGAEKQKGGLRVDSLAYMLEGGDQGASIVPGDVSQSLLISCLYLPLDDDLRMPPEGKPQLTTREITILEEWVRAGSPEGVRVSEMVNSSFFGSKVSE